jgi:ribosome maturation factor RimP
MNVHTVLEQTLPELGYELVDLELTRGGAIRIFIDSPKGISIDDCTLVHHQLSRVFMVEGIDYERLEISSPGLDRPLKKREDYQRFIGHDVRLKTYQPIGYKNQRNFVGRLLAFEDDQVMIETVEYGEVKITFMDIEKARLQPNFAKKRD